MDTLDKDFLCYCSSKSNSQLKARIQKLAESSAEDSFEVHNIPISNGPYTIPVPVLTEDTEIAFTIDEEKFLASGGNCHLNSSVEFHFPCPVECCNGACVLNIKLPEVSFMELLTAKVNDTHEIVYVHVANVSRITMFISEIRNITEILIGFRDLDMPNDKYQLNLQHISSAQSGMLTFDNSSFSNLCTNESEVELAWRFLGKTSAINASNITCYSNEEPICGLSSPCVLGNEGAHSLLRYTAKRGPENMVLYTCLYKENENVDQVTYRIFWPGSDRFVGQTETLTASSNEVELEWIVNHWGPHDYRRFECYADDQLLCSGLTTTSEEGMCHVNDYGEIYVFTLTAWRKQNSAMARYVCRTAAAFQERTIFWKNQIGSNAKEYIPEYVISISGGMLSHSVANYLKEAQISSENEATDVVRISPKATFEVTCSITVENSSWLCNVYFKKAVLQLPMNPDLVSRCPMTINMYYPDRIIARLPHAVRTLLDSCI
nr:unnamed protein product [Spirometra erinaceieuropaei]